MRDNFQFPEEIYFFQRLNIGIEASPQFFSFIGLS